MIVCAGQNEQFPFATPVGIGITQAAINTTQIAIKHRPNALLFIGTAGSYGNALPFDLCCSHHCKTIEISFLESKSYTPISLQILAQLPQNVSRETFPFYCVNSSHYITSDWSHNSSFIELGCEIENMEFYGFLSAAVALNIDAFGLFCITNYCDANAHKEFIANHNRAKELLTEAVNRHFKAFL
jgi:purine-nucleoside phosphorylase